jgi:hypothetical protein
MENSREGNMVTDSESIIKKNQVLKELMEILQEVLTILPYEVYRIHHGVNSSKNSFVMGIGGVGDIRDIGDLFMSMQLGDGADHTRPGASFYIRRGKDNELLDSSHDLHRIRGIFKKYNIGDTSYEINFDTYLGNIGITMDVNILDISS